MAKYPPLDKTLYFVYLSCKTCVHLSPTATLKINCEDLLMLHWISLNIYTPCWTIRREQLVRSSTSLFVHLDLTRVNTDLDLLVHGAASRAQPVVALDAFLLGPLARVAGVTLLVPMQAFPVGELQRTHQEDVRLQRTDTLHWHCALCATQRAEERLTWRHLPKTATVAIDRSWLLSVNSGFIQPNVLSSREWLIVVHPETINTKYAPLYP